jgi:hypothetical protein
VSENAGRARAQIAAAGVTARDAVAQALAVMAGEPALPGREPAASWPDRAAIGAGLAWAVLVTVLSMFTVLAVVFGAFLQHGARLAALTAGAAVLIAALQLYHSAGARRGRRPRPWPVDARAAGGAGVYVRVPIHLGRG